MNSFITELETLLKKYSIHLSGTLRIVHLDEQWDLDTRSIEQMAIICHGGIPDTTGPFLVASISEKPPVPVEIVAGKRFHINPDIAGYDCPVSGKWIGSRREHRENLKRKGCRILEHGESRDAPKNQARMLEEGCKRTAHEMVRNIAHQVDF